MTVVMVMDMKLNVFRCVKSLEKFSKHLTQDLVDRLHFFLNYQEEDTLHDIRVEIKKVKAVLSLLGHSHKKFNTHKAFLPYRTIFRKADAIREPIILNTILSDNQLTETNNDQPRLLKGPTVEAFLDDIPFHIESVLSSWKKLKPWIRTENRKEFKGFMRKKKKEVEKGIFPTPDMENIHAIRKKIKAILYLSKIKGDLSKTEEKFYHEMEQTIGQWHDKQVLQANLNNLNGRADKEKIKKLVSMIKLDKSKMKTMAGDFYQLN